MSLLRRKELSMHRNKKRTKNLIFIINIDEDLKYISDASDDNVDDNEHDK
jgi:hypothetical protein